LGAGHGAHEDGATVDDDRRAGDVASGVRNEKQERANLILRLADEVQRNAAEPSGPKLRVGQVGPIEVGFGQAWCKGVDTDTVGGQLEGHLPRQRPGAGL
jgi:hypothetical protein